MTLLTLLFVAQTAQAEGDVTKGREVYMANCLTCHGEKFNGKGPAGIYLRPAPRSLATDSFKNGDKPEQIQASVSNGLPGTAMSGFAKILSAEQIRNVTAFIGSLRKNRS